MTFDYTLAVFPCVTLIILVSRIGSVLRTSISETEVSGTNADGTAEASARLKMATRHEDRILEKVD